MLNLNVKNTRVLTLKHQDEGCTSHVSPDCDSTSVKTDETLMLFVSNAVTRGPIVRRGRGVCVMCLWQCL